MTENPMNPDYHRMLLNTDPKKTRPLLHGHWTPDTWRPPAMTADGGPLPCPECRDGKHPNCDGSSWSEVDDAPADCPCGDPAHQTTDLGENPHLPPEYADALHAHEERTFLPDGCECVIVYTAAGSATRIPHDNCPLPPETHQDHRRQEHKSKPE